MSKFFNFFNKRSVNLLFPLADYIYIFQLLEYNRSDFTTWVAKRLLIRNLQTIGKIDWTIKAKLLYIITFIEILIFAAIASFALADTSIPLLLLILLPTIFLLIPFWVVVASLATFPLEGIIKKLIARRAKLKLRKIKNLKIIAVAGSVGKSSTRSFLTELLGTKFKTFTPKENYNTILGISEQINENLKVDTQCVVLEFGEYKPEDLIKLAEFAYPEIVVFTKVGSQHMTNFGSQENINREFLTLANFSSVSKIIIDKSNILSKDLEHSKKIIYSDIGETTKLMSKQKGLNLPNASSTIENLSLAITCAIALGVGNEQMLKTLPKLSSFSQRLSVSKVKEITIIDDSYNISVESAQNALDFLKTFKSRKIVVTGGIVEQGKNATRVNENFGKQLSKVADIVIVANNQFHEIITNSINASGSEVKVLTSTHPSETPEILAQTLKKDDVVLIQNELPEIYWH